MRLVMLKSGNPLGIETMPVRPFDPIGSSPYGKYLLCQYLSEFIIEKNNELETSSPQFIDDFVFNPDKIMLELF